MTTPENPELQPAVTAEFAALAALLESLPAERWDTPSLCDGWRIREVVAHVTMAARYSPAEFEAELRESAFDFDHLSDRIAHRDGARPVAELLADLRSDTMRHWTPPHGGHAGALNHIVIHGLDITVPLGVDRICPDETIRTVLDGMTRGGIHQHFGTDIDGVALRATDLDWSFGAGREIAATAQDIVLTLSGRRFAGVADDDPGQNAGSGGTEKASV